MDLRGCPELGWEVAPPTIPRCGISHLFKMSTFKILTLLAGVLMLLSATAMVSTTWEPSGHVLRSKTIVGIVLRPRARSLLAVGWELSYHYVGGVATWCRDNFGPWLVDITGVVGKRVLALASLRERLSLKSIYSGVRARERFIGLPNPFYRPPTYFDMLAAFWAASRKQLIWTVVGHALLCLITRWEGIIILFGSLCVEELVMRQSWFFAVTVAAYECARISRWQRHVVRFHFRLPATRLWRERLFDWHLPYYLLDMQSIARHAGAHAVMGLVRVLVGNNAASFYHLAWDLQALADGAPLLARDGLTKSQKRARSIKASRDRVREEASGAMDAALETIRDLRRQLKGKDPEHRPEVPGSSAGDEDECDDGPIVFRAHHPPPGVCVPTRPGSPDNDRQGGGSRGGRRGRCNCGRGSPPPPPGAPPPTPPAGPARPPVPPLPHPQTMPPGHLDEEFFAMIQSGRRVYFDFSIPFWGWVVVGLACFTSSFFIFLVGVVVAAMKGRFWLIVIGAPVPGADHDVRPDGNALSECEHQSQLYWTTWYVLNWPEGSVFTERHILDFEIVAQLLAAANTCVGVAQYRSTIRAFARRYCKVNVDRTLVLDEQFIVPFSADFAVLLAEKMGRHLLAGPCSAMLCWPVAYGIRCGEFQTPEIGPVKTNTHVFISKLETDRRPVATSLGPVFIGAKRPKLDPRDWLTMFLGAMKRVCKRPPPVDAAVRVRILRYVRRWLKRHVQPIPIESDDSFETWLTSTRYPESRKEQLRRDYDEVKDLFSPEVTGVKCFIKDETYGEYKHARWIMSRTDYWKCFYGPLIRLAEAAIYTHPAFIKHCSESERARKVRDTVWRPGDLCMETDFTAFESHLDNPTMRTFEMPMLEYLFQGHPGLTLLKKMNRVVAGRNKLWAKFVYLVVEARMSGEMSTSLGNGFTDLMIVKFVCFENGNRHVRGLVEGDDGLFTMTGRLPTAAQFAACGFTIKIKSHPDVAEAGFCGMIFDPDAGAFITDPAKVLLNFGWGTRQYVFANVFTRMALLRAKAMSYMCQYGACPIITAYCARMLELTSSVSNDKLLAVVNKMKISAYERAKLLFAYENQAKPRAIDMATRLLFDRVFSVSVEDQCVLEQQFAHLTLKPTDFPAQLEHLVHDDCRDYFERFVVFEPHPYGLCPFAPMRDSRVVRWAAQIYRECR